MFAAASLPVRSTTIWASGADSKAALRAGIPSSTSGSPTGRGGLGTARSRVTLVETGENTQTAARVRKAGKYVESDTFCLTYGDGVGNVDINALLAFLGGLR